MDVIGVRFRPSVFLAKNVKAGSMKKFFLLITLLSINLVQTSSAQVQSSVSSDEVFKIVEHSKLLIDQAKKRGLSDLQIIEELDTVLAEAAFASDSSAIQGKGRNLQRLLWIAGGVGTGLTVAAIICAIVHYYNQVATKSPGENEIVEPQAEEEVVVTLVDNNENVQLPPVNYHPAIQLPVVRQRVYPNQQQAVRQSTRIKRQPKRYGF
jgi:hypothetical protein